MLVKACCHIRCTFCYDSASLCVCSISAEREIHSDHQVAVFRNCWWHSHRISCAQFHSRWLFVRSCSKASVNDGWFPIALLESEGQAAFVQLLKWGNRHKIPPPLSSIQLLQTETCHALKHGELIQFFWRLNGFKLLEIVLFDTSVVTPKLFIRDPPSFQAWPPPLSKGKNPHCRPLRNCKTCSLLQNSWRS